MIAAGLTRLSFDLFQFFLFMFVRSFVSFNNDSPQSEPNINQFSLWFGFPLKKISWLLKKTVGLSNFDDLIMKNKKRNKQKLLASVKPNTGKPT